jgi:Ni,Fe-hydrogenase I cytochrome b subunit
MFDSLDEQMKHDDAAVTSRERLAKWVAVATISILAFGGLYMAIRMLE